MTKVSFSKAFIDYLHGASNSKVNVLPWTSVVHIVLLYSAQFSTIQYTALLSTTQYTILYCTLHSIQCNTVQTLVPFTAQFSSVQWWPMTILTMEAENKERKV